MTWAPASELAPGDRLADHDILSTAGRGASAVVYRARHRPTGELRALKVLNAAPGKAGQQTPCSPGAAELRHPGIIAVLGGGLDGGLAWQSMEWVAGHDLGRYTQTRRLLPEILTMELGERLALALDHAHRQGVIHRDIKPANVRVHLAQRVIKIGDFGIAKTSDSEATMTGVLKGTPSYMPPELLAGAQATSASDLYSLGAVLYEMFTGRRPHEADSMGGLLRKVTSEDIVPPSLANHTVPVEVDAIMQQLLNRSPQARQPTGAHLAAQLAQLRSALQGVEDPALRQR